MTNVFMKKIIIIKQYENVSKIITCTSWIYTS